MGVTVHLYNCTPFIMEVVAKSRDSSWSSLGEIHHSNDRIVRIKDAATNYPLVKITLKDIKHRPIKQAEFYTYYDYSWVITDTEIRRQNYGSALYVAEPYTDKDKEAYFRSSSDYKWKSCNKIKQYDWKSLCTDVCLYNGVDDSCPAPQLVFLKELERQSYQSHSMNDFGLSTTIHIFNDSPYCLDIQMIGDSKSKIYWNDPASCRVLKIQTPDKYPFIIINVVDVSEQILKYLSFYTWHDYSWIVTDECVVRQKYGSALYVADEYADDQKVEYFQRSGANYKWDYCDRIKRYSWTSDTEVVLYTGEETSDSVRKNEKSRASSFFVEAVHPSSLSEPDANQKIVACLIIQWITFKNLHRRAPGQTIITATEPAIGRLMECFNSRAQDSALRRIRDPSSFRLDFQRSQGSVCPYNVFAIQHENRQYATVFIHQDLTENDIPVNRLRNAFLRSVNKGIEVWISGSSTSSPERIVCCLLASYFTGIAGRNLFLWGRKR